MLEGAPAQYLMPAVRPTVEEARAWCHHLATSHYENFHVVTWFLPKEFKTDFEALYSYCRASDDLGDEVATPEIGMRLLEEWGVLLRECYEAPERTKHPIFVALTETIRERQIPMQPFLDLLAAFKADQTKTRHASIAELEEYSVYSANPVGRMILHTCGYHDETLNLLSDKICTALQLANFWQDVGEDWDRGRVYLPQDWMARFGVTEEQIAARRTTPQFREMMRGLVAETRAMFNEGAALERGVEKQLAVTLRLFRRGGESILNAIEALGYDTLTRRPVVTKAAKVKLLGRAFVEKMVA